MSLYELMPCTGAMGCGHPRREHRTTDRKKAVSVCTHPLGQGRTTCACTGFKEVRTGSSVPKKRLEVSGG